MLKIGCRGQALSALSSAESDVYSLTTAASELLGERSFSMDLGAGTVDIDRRHGWCGTQLSQGQWSSEVSRYVVLLGARRRDEGRNQDQETPHVGKSIGHLDQSSTIKHNLVDDGDHELQIRDGPSWTDIDGLRLNQSSFARQMCCVHSKVRNEVLTLENLCS